MISQLYPGYRFEMKCSRHFAILVTAAAIGAALLGVPLVIVFINAAVAAFLWARSHRRGFGLTARSQALVTQCADGGLTYEDRQAGFSITVPAGWRQQPLVRSFRRTGGRVAVASEVGAAHFNVSVGRLDRSEWADREARALAVARFAKQAPGSLAIRPADVSDPLSGEQNTVRIEYDTSRPPPPGTRLAPFRFLSGLMSTLHAGREYTIQWRAIQGMEAEVRTIIESFRFTQSQRQD